jgi:hypothetical protein
MPTDAPSREDRLAAALRANLRKRKEQQRAAGDQAGGPPPEAEGFAVPPGSEPEAVAVNTVTNP